MLQEVLPIVLGSFNPLWNNLKLILPWPKPSIDSVFWIINQDVKLVTKCNQCTCRWQEMITKNLFIKNKFASDWKPLNIFSSLLSCLFQIYVIIHGSHYRKFDFHRNIICYYNICMKLISYDTCTYNYDHLSKVHYVFVSNQTCIFILTNNMFGGGDNNLLKIFFLLIIVKEIKMHFWFSTVYVW